MRNTYLFLFFLGIVVIAVLAAVLSIVGTPTSQAQISLDRTRSSNFSSIKYAVDSYYTRNNKLPEKLSDLPPSVQYVDPQTKKDYEYKIVSQTSFQLCTTFSVDSAGLVKGSPYSTLPPKEYKKGYNCFDYSVSSYNLRISPTLPTYPSPTVYYTSPSISPSQFEETKVNILAPTWSESLCIGRNYTVRWVTKGKNLEQAKIALYTRPDGKYFDITNVMPKTTFLVDVGSSGAESGNNNQEIAGAYNWKIGTTASGVQLSPATYYVTINALFGSKWIAGYGGDFTVKNCN